MTTSNGGKRKEQIFLRCSICGNIVGVINDAGVSMMCCGQKMDQLVPNKVDASQEKHVPAVTVSGDTVTVKIGSEAHPMLPEHYIEWVYIETENGGQRKTLKPGTDPVAVFSLNNDKVISVFEYCNLHGLWVTTL